MIFTSVPVPTLPLVDASLNPMGHNRPAGLHLSTIIKAMREEEGEILSSIAGEDPSIRPLLGFLWERAVDAVWNGVPISAALEAAWKDYLIVAKLDLPDRGEVETQCKLELDGILMTPDGLAISSEALPLGGPAAPGTIHRKTPLRIESYKLTWRSMKKWREDAASAAAGEPLEFFSHWMIAEAGYLHAFNQINGWALDTVRFFICWTQGDYSRKPGGGCQMSVTDVTFTPEELQANWDKVLMQAESLRKGKAA